MFEDSDIILSGHKIGWVHALLQDGVVVSLLGVSETKSCGTDFDH